MVVANEEVALRNMLIAVFKRKGGIGKNTKSADEDFPFLGKTVELSRLLETGELPVIFILHEGHAETVITTRRIIWLAASAGKAVKFNQISNISASQLGGKMLSKETGLRLHLIDGSDVVLDVEAGRPLSGVWNVLLNRARVNWRKARSH